MKKESKVECICIEKETERLIEGGGRGGGEGEGEGRKRER